MISFVVPAHNEELWIGRCLDAITAAMREAREPYEVVVVDDSSDDATGALAAAGGARVIRIDRRHISASRNAGAKEATGDILFFVDADTLMNAEVVQSALACVRGGAVGGGCVVQFDGQLPLWWRAVYPALAAGCRLFRQTGGACLFCTRTAFDAVGSFSEQHFAAEEAVFVRALKRYGRFVVPRQTVVTSGRSLRAHSFGTIARIFIRLALFGPAGFNDRRGLDLWYRPLRESR